MALACNLSPVASAQPRSFAITASTAGRHRQPRTSFSLPICARSEQMKGRVLTWTIGESLGTEAKKKLTKLQSRRKREFSSSNAEVSASGQGIPGAENASGEGGDKEVVPDFDLSRLEAFTERFRGEVLCVNALLEEEEEEEEEGGVGEEQVIVFKGFSSSLTRPTPEDPSEPALPPTAVIQSIDRLRAPYNPSNPRYIEQGISWQEFHHFMEAQGF